MRPRSVDQRRAGEPLGSVVRPPRLVTSAFARVWTGLFLTAVTFGMALPVVPRLVTGSLAGGDVAVGIVVGAYTVSSVVLRPVFGHLADRLGRWMLVVAGGIASAGGLLAHVWADGVVSLAVARTTVGAGYGALIVGLMTTGLDDIQEERRGTSASYLMVAMQLGVGVGPVFGELVLLSSNFGAVWVCAAGVAVGGAVLGASGMSRGPMRSRDHTRSGTALHPAALGPGLVGLLAVAGFAGFLTFVPLHAQEIGMEGVASVLFLSSLVVVASRLLGAGILDVHGPRVVVRTGLVLQACGLLLMASWNTTVGVYVSVVIMSLGWSAVPPALLHAATQSAGANERARAVSTFTMLTDSGLAVGPVVLGYAASVGGYGSVFAAGAGFALVALVVVVSGRSARPSEADVTTPRR